MLNNITNSVKIDLTEVLSFIIDPKCRNICTLEYNPQCGTDGKTYGNPCQFRGALCESDGHVKLAHHGECST